MVAAAAAATTLALPLTTNSSGQYRPVPRALPWTAAQPFPANIVSAEDEDEDRGESAGGMSEVKALK